MLNKVICLVVLGFLMAALCIIGATEGLIDYLRNPTPLKNLVG